MRDGFHEIFMNPLMETKDVLPLFVDIIRVLWDGGVWILVIFCESTTMLFSEDISSESIDDFILVKNFFSLR